MPLVIIIVMPLLAMASLLLLLPPLFSFLFFPIISSATPLHSPKPYIVYMGSSWNFDHNERLDAKLAESSHLQLLSSIIPSQESERISLIHTYHHAFRGFSAMLTEDEASLLSKRDEVISVFPEPKLELHTTHSWDFLYSISDLGSKINHQHHHHHFSNDVIIGVIDTGNSDQIVFGIWPESPSFKDEHIGEIPSKWKGECMEGFDFNKSNCNRKLIGARYYKPNMSPRDTDNHGTHVASIAAGAPVANASFYGLARGKARGGSPAARIASYNVCYLSEKGRDCPGATVMKAIDDAMKDGVDILSVSLGGPSVEFFEDPVAIGAFHAEEMGVMFISSAGNVGPNPFTVSNNAPWIVSVAASTTDREFQSNVILGNGKTIKGFAINFSNFSRSEMYPLVLAEDIAINNSVVSSARECDEESLDSKKASGKIIVCINSTTELPVVKGSIGLILVSEIRKIPHESTDSFPLTVVGKNEEHVIWNYIKSTKKPTASILQSVDALGFKPSPIVANFSSRGPGNLTENILKPDIMAPGVDILGAIIPGRDEQLPPDGIKKPSDFSLISGTSQACPHVSGAAAFIKSVHPSWSSSIIRSALMTTATFSNNLGKPLTNELNYPASPHETGVGETGVGEISPIRALDPGLVFETKLKDYLHFLCYYGYSEKIVKNIAKVKTKCPKGSKEELISSKINYPSISLGKLDRSKKPVQVITRKVTNLGPANSSYFSSVFAPNGLQVKVYPKEISFNEGKRRASFKVLFNAKNASKGYKFGHVMWKSNKYHRVRVVFAVNIY